jgi:hypothetical protein
MWIFPQVEGAGERLNSVGATTWRSIVEGLITRIIVKLIIVNKK